LAAQEVVAGNPGAAAPGPGARRVRQLTHAFHAAIAVIAIAWAAGLAVRFGLQLYTEQVLATLLMLSVAVTFITYDRHGNSRSYGIPWYDWALCGATLAAFGYVALQYPRLAENIYFNPTETFILSILMVPLLCEALRRTTGWALLVVFLVFFVYALTADLVPGTLRGRAQDFFRLMPMLGIDGTAMFGAPLAVVVTVVLAFVFMGQLLFAAGGGTFFTELSAALMGRSRGGSAKISVLASAFFGSISGSVVANVTSTGIITIPLMKQAGFRPQTAAAIEAVASNGGQLMPPVMGAAAFLMADFLGISYASVMLAALVPALLYFLAVFIQVDLEAAKLGIGAEDASKLPRARDVLRQGWIFPIPFVVLLVCLFSLNMPPEMAAIYSSIALVAIALLFPHKGRRLTLAAIWDSVVSTGATAVQIAIICGVAGMIIGILNITGLGFALGLVLLEAGKGSLLLLLVLTALVCIVLGMSMPTTSLYILLATLAVPPLVKLGVEPIAAHLFVLYFGMMSFITPPVCFAAFAAANIAKASPMGTGFTAMRLGWLAYVVPFLFVYSPSLLLIGSWSAIALAILTAVAGIWLICAALLGILLSPIGMLQRLLFGAAGIALLIPADAFPGALSLEIAGLVAGTVLFLHHVRQARVHRAGLGDSAAARAS
jgi:TRAP transporter 4TM/12TM fusion protein